MILTTLCYLEKEDSYLMLHRVKKKKDVNKDKWIGIGGKFEKDESPEECLLREAREETGLTLTSFRLRGVITFVCPPWDSECMFLYTADGWEGEIGECPEGTLEWVPKGELDRLNLWEGDRIFFKLLAENGPFFSLKCVYAGDRLDQAVLNGTPLPAGWADGEMSAETFKQRRAEQEDAASLCALRPWRMEDAPSLAAVINNRKVQDNLRDGIPFPYSEADARAFLGEILTADPETLTAFAITVKDTVAGSISVTRGGNVHSRTAELGYYLGEAFWGKGIATAAVEQICRYVFEKTDILRIYAEPFAYNTASCRVLEKNGFHFEGTLKSNAVKNGKVQDMKMYALVREKGEFR